MPAAPPEKKAKAAPKGPSIPEILDKGPDRKCDRPATIHGKTAEAPSLIYQNRAGGKATMQG